MSAAAPLRVLALLPYPVGIAPGQRYRIEQWAPWLREHGIEVELSACLTQAQMRWLYRSGHLARKAWAALAGHLRRLRQMRRWTQYDVAYLYREATFFGPPWVEARLARRWPIVYDFDDAIYLPTASTAHAWVARLKRRDKAAEICRLARDVTVGNESLAIWARVHNPRVSVIPSTIDTDAYVLRERPENPKPVVGWTGSPTTAPYLATLGPALLALSRRVEFELKVIGARIDLPGLDVRCQEWNAATEADDLRTVDVGLMPLADDEWSRGKCALKALQYMALGIPAVVSPVGVNASIVCDGVNGFHARSDTDWVDRIALLLGDRDLRQRLGASARRTVETGFSARVQAPRMAEVLLGAARRAG
jgi:glycosyltransferase involved in cell wall biosynthesis